MIRFAAHFRNAIIFSLIVITPWAFASVHEFTQIFAKSLLTALAFSYLLLNFLRPPPAPPTQRETVLAGITFVLLLFGVIALFNSRFSFLPSTIDPRQTAFALWGYAGLAALFWATRDWIREDPAATRRLLWVMLVNAGLIGVVAIAQRLTGASREVLWIYRPIVTSRFYTFGPFEYRGTAAEFFDLLWPIALGLYLQDRSFRAGRIGFPVSLVVLLAACPLITSSRGGLLVAALCGAIMITALLLSRNLAGQSVRRLFVITIAALTLFFCFGYKPFEKRWRESKNVQTFLNLGGRLPQNENSWRMISDHPLWGVGPGAYESAFRAYAFPNAFKPDRDIAQERPAWDFFYAKAHNDWLQTLAEWGFPAMLLIVWGLLLIMLTPFSEPTAEPLLNLGLAIGIMAVLFHAAFDYPLQNFAILIHFVLVLAICSIRREATPILPSPAENTPPSAH